MRVLVVIPAYNEEESIERVVGELRSTAPECDYIIVNDCSSDGTAAIIEKNGFNRLNVPVNLGIGGGVQTGYKYAVQEGYDIVVQMDGDGQHDARFLRSIIAPVENGEADLCIGSRFIDKIGFQTSSMRRFGIAILRNLIKFCCGVRVTDATSGFRACTIALAKHYTTHYAQDYPEPEAIVSAAKSGFRVKEVPVEMRERLGGKSSINGFRSAYFMMKVSLAILIYRLTPSKKGK